MAKDEELNDAEEQKLSDEEAPDMETDMEDAVNEMEDGEVKSIPAIKFQKLQAMP
jgi:hypothetical protein